MTSGFRLYTEDSIEQLAAHNNNERRDCDGKRLLIEEPDTEEKFADMPILRDIEACKQCDFFRMKEDGKCLCTNVYKQYGHPWCRESRFSLKPEWFAKANIFILDESRCANIAK